MRNFKTKGIVIREYNVGEADRIIVVFSRDLGVITLKARGVRKILAKLKGHLGLFTYVLLEVHQSAKSQIGTIIGAEAIHSFKKLRSNLKNTSRIFLIFEFVNRILPEREKQKNIFVLLLYFLRELEKETKRGRRLVLSSYFLLRALKELGYAPHFRECIRCRAKLKRGGNYFDRQNGGTICPACSQIDLEQFQVGLIQISDFALLGLRILNENKSRRLPKIKAKKEILEEMAVIIEDYIEYILESELRSKKFVKQVDN